MATTWQQTHYRFRNNDGSESTATWKAAADTAITLDCAAGRQVLRLRINATETGTTAGALTARLYGTLNGGAYGRISATSAYVQAYPSAKVTDDGATTQQISSGTFVAGKMDDVDCSCSATASLSQNNVTEHEYVLVILSEQLAHGDVLTFRERNSTTAFATYSVTAQITISKTLRSLTTPAGYAEAGFGDSLTGWGYAQSKTAYADMGLSFEIPVNPVYEMVAAYGAYSLVGESIHFLLARTLGLGYGTYTLTGEDVTLTYTPSGPTYTLSLAQGSYVLTGETVQLVISRKLVLVPGSYILTGEAVGLIYSGGVTIVPIVLSSQQGHFF